jgi:NitT/TauT family transport system ATP-binding protein
VFTGLLRFVYECRDFAAEEIVYSKIYMAQSLKPIANGRRRIERIGEILLEREFSRHPCSIRFDTCDRGEASGKQTLLNGRDLLPGTAGVGLVFQEYALFPWRTTLQNIEMGLEIRGMDKPKRRLTAMEYIKTFDLNGFEHRYPRELSGGMKQRVAIARTLIMNPRVVLMDEPFGSLDSQTRNAMQEFLLRIWLKRGDTIIFVTHNVEEAVFLSDEIVILSKRPARLIQSIDMDIPRPRDRTSETCNKIRRGILKILEEEMKREEVGDEDRWDRL